MEKLTVLITGPIYERALDKLQQKANILFSKKGASETELIDLVKKQNTNLFIVRGGKINSRVIESAPNLKAIIKHGVGVNNIDIDEARKRNIPVYYTPNANYESVAEHALAFMMVLIKQINLYDQEMKREKQWCQGKFQPIELKGKTIGLIGLGRIAKRLTELLQPFQVKILAYDPLLQISDVPQKVGMVQSIDHLLSVSDIVSIHCPLNKETEKIIGSKELSKMKKSAFLVNTARGAVVDQDALINALKNGNIAGAGLDTFTQEPLPGDSHLYEMKNVILTPHIGGTAIESFIRMGEESVEIAIKVIEEKTEDIHPENKIF